MIVEAFPVRFGDEYLSKNFRVKEFFCKDGSPVVLVSPDLVEVLQATRDRFERRLIINSAYRTPSYNAKIGGAKDSQHMYGTAADFHIDGVTPAKIADFLETILPHSGGIGIYRTFIHVDVRNKKSRWKE